MIATLLAIIGCTLIFFTRGDIVVDSLGIIFSLWAGLSYSSYTVFSKRLLEKHHPYAVVSLVFLFSAFVLISLSIGQNYSWILSVRGTMVAMHLGLVTASLAYILFSKGLLNTPAATAVSLTLAGTLTAAALGVMVLKERLDGYAFLGVFLLVIGLIILMRSAARESSKSIKYIEV